MQKTRRKHEVVADTCVSVWDDFPCTWADRYTVVDLESVDKYGRILALSMNEMPFSPNMGVCYTVELFDRQIQYTGRGGIFRKRIKFADLPADCQKAAIQWLNDKGD